MPKLDMIGNIISKVADNVDRFTLDKQEKAELIEQLGYDPDRDPMQDYWDSESDKIAIAQEELEHETS